MIEQQLWHYTCNHSRTLIGRNGFLLPPMAWQADRFMDRINDLDGLLQASLVWLTDLDEPDIDGLGLTSHILRCDRSQHRYRVLSNRGVIPFGQIQHKFSASGQASLLTAAARPEHWFVSFNRVPVEYAAIASVA